MKTLDKMHSDVLKRILDLKDKRGLSDKDFGIECGVGEKAIDNWKRENSASFMKKLDSIAEFFNVTTDYLLTGNEQENKPAAESDELDETEKRIIQLLRLVPPEDRELLVGMIEGALKSRGLLK